MCGPETCFSSMKTVEVWAGGNLFSTENKLSKVHKTFSYPSLIFLAVWNIAEIRMMVIIIKQIPKNTLPDISFA